MAVVGTLNLLFKATTKHAVAGMSKLRSAISSTTGAISSLSGSAAMVTGAATAAGGAISALALTSAGSVRDTQKWADSLGIASTRLDAMNKVARQFGIEGDMVADSMKDLGVKIDLALQEGGGISDLFKLNGIELSKFRKLSNDQKLFTFFDAIKDVDPQRAATLMDEINDSMFQLSPLLKQNGVDFKKLTMEIEASGNVLNNMQRGSLLALNQSWSRLTGAMQFFKDQISAKIAPVLQRLFDHLTNNASSLGDSFVTSIKSMITWTKRLVIIFDSGFSLMFSAVKKLATILFTTTQMLTNLTRKAGVLKILDLFGDTGKAVDDFTTQTFDETMKKLGGAFVDSIKAADNVKGPEWLERLSSLINDASELTSEAVKESVKLGSKSGLGGILSNTGSSIRATAQQIDPNKIRLGATSGMNTEFEQLKVQRKILTVNERFISTIDQFRLDMKSAFTTKGNQGIGQGTLS